MSTVSKKEETEFLLLLDLLSANQENAYVSCMSICRKKLGPLERIEVFLPNVGRLCYYQSFIENWDGIQIPKIRISYGFCRNKKISVYRFMNDETLSIKAARLVVNMYRNKQLSVENTNVFSKDEDVIKRIKKNQNLFYKYYKNIFEQRQQYLLIKYKTK
ncbi:MAG: hypothetical protein MJ156_02925 [Alphaproteobacteria bacterium]|nr:hypothetical protein [Alphaproteobacteria bacterium]